MISPITQASPIVIFALFLEDWLFIAHSLYRNLWLMVHHLNVAGQSESFGNPLTSIGITPNVYRFSGEQYDSSLDAYYFRARYYSPSIGRFLSADHFLGDPEAPETDRN